MRWFWIIGGIALSLGVGLLFVMGSMWHEQSMFEARAARAEGRVKSYVWEVSSDMHHNTRHYAHLVIDFTTFDGQNIEITDTQGSNPPSFPIGATVPVLYDPAQPRHVLVDTVGSRVIPMVVLGVFTTVFLLLGGGMLGFAIRRFQRHRWLAAHGTRIQARLESVAIDSTTSVNDRHPWRLRAQWQHPVTRKVYRFESDSIWFDPRAYLRRDSVDVIVNIDNPKQYEVDLSFLPELG